MKLRYLFGKVYDIVFPLVVIIVAFLSLSSLAHLLTGANTVSFKFVFYYSSFLFYDVLFLVLLVSLRISLHFYVLWLIAKKRKEREQNEL